MLLCSQHENRKDKLSSQEHLNEETLRDTGAASKSRAHIQITREHAANKTSSSKTAQDLSEEQKCATNPRKRSNKAHANRDGWVEQSTRNTEEDPCEDGKRETEAQRDVLQLLRVGTSLLDGETGG